MKNTASIKVIFREKIKNPTMTTQKTFIIPQKNGRLILKKKN